jgi:hypothetical protein
MASDPALLAAYRKQLTSLAGGPGSPELVFMAWVLDGQVDRDDLIDVYKEVTGAEPPP